MSIRTITSKPALHEECAYVADSLKRESRLGQIVGRSKAVQALRREIVKASSCNVDVLISGESGTGKELVARAIHYLSKRASRPFVPVNCGAIPESLFENELFGHVKGAFTDAGLHQIGLVKEAEHGTLFLDEIGVTSAFVQVKLLRLLQNREYRPIGDITRHRADIRVLAATNRDLQNLLDEGTFRKDLFYRLNVVSIHVPPLRERREDIPILAKHFTKIYAREYSKPVEGLTEKAINRLISHSWPGNVRELEHEVQRAVVMSEDTLIDVGSIRLATSRPEPERSGLDSFNVAKKRVIDSFAQTYLVRLLTECHGNVVKAAIRAGKSRTGLWNLLRKYGIDPSLFRSPDVHMRSNVKRGELPVSCVTKE